MKEVANTDAYKFSRLMYIIEAALEYFIAIAVSSIYLAKIADYIGIQDGLTAILSAFVSLGGSFQLIAIFLGNKRPVKRWVTFSHTISQALFASMYLIPIVPMSTAVKTVVFVGVFLIAQIIHNVINSHKINWFMSLVDDGKRGRFTANKEIVSLLGGMAFSYGMGLLMDYFEAQNNIRMAFIIGAITLFVLMVGHSLTLILSKEKPVEKDFTPKPIKEHLSNLFQNKTLFKIIFISILWNIANNATTSFSGTYQTKELGFTTAFASLIILIGSFARVLFSKPMGKLADKTSFCKMLTICFTIMAGCFALNIFTAPSNGKVLYSIYYIGHCIGMAGINSSIINLIYDYVGKEERTCALALQQAFGGLVGFLITLVLSPVITQMQAHGNSIFGMTVYAQQIFSLFSTIMTVVLLVYMNVVVRKLERVDNKRKEQEE
jgi:Na+/melibiose symporter-like transporter